MPHTLKASIVVIALSLLGAWTNSVGQVVFFDDFESGADPRWSHRTTDTTPIGERHFLGQFGNDLVKLTLDSLPPHESIRADFDLFVIQSCDGNSRIFGSDVWEFAVDDERLLTTTFSNIDEPGYLVNQAYPGTYPGGDFPPYTGASERDSLGYPYFGDAVYHLTLTAPHTSEAASFAFSASGLEPLDNESWGLDNVSITLAEDICHVGWQNGCMIDRPGTGSYFAGDIWENFTVPGPGHVARFGCDWVTHPPHVLHFGDFCYNVPNCGVINVQGGQASPDAVVIATGNWVFDFGPGGYFCNPPGNDHGSLVTTSHFAVGGIVRETGEPGVARLVIRGGGNLTLGGGNGLLVGYDGSQGDLTISGVGTDVHLAGGAFGITGAEPRGMSQLVIEDGATLSSGYLGIVGSGGPGTLVLRDPGTRLEMNGQFWLGNGPSSNGTVVISNGAELVSHVWVGMPPNDVARLPSTLTVTGAGSRLTGEGYMTLGHNARASLNVTNGGELSTQYISLGDRGMASLTVSRSGSAQIGNQLDLGFWPTGDGILKVAGFGSTLNVAKWMTLGLEGAAALQVTSGATVRCGEFCRIGEAAGATGRAIVRGAGSAWTVGQFLTFGENGAASLEVTDGASVCAGWDLLIGGFQNSRATARVSGADSELLSTSWLYVGREGSATGELLVGPGARVESTAGDVNIGTWHSSTGTVTVTGPESVLRSALWTWVGRGDDARGTLIVEDGGRAESGGDFNVGGGGIGEVTVRGADSTLTCVEWLEVGREGDGDGTLTIQDGAAAQGRNAHVAWFSPESKGRVVVDGAGSRLTAADGVYVGEQGSGSLTLVDGGSVSSTLGLEISTRGLLTGAGTVIGGLRNFGHVSPGQSAGVLQVDGSYLQEARNGPETGVLTIELSGTRSPLRDRLQVSGEAALSGTLELALIDDFRPRHGDSFPVVEAAAVRGSYDAVRGSPGPGLRWKAEYHAADVSVTAVSDVNCADIQDWRVRCANGKLTVKITTALSPGTQLLIDNSGSRKSLTIGDDAKVAWKNQTGQREISIVECPEFNRLMDCG